MNRSATFRTVAAATLGLAALAASTASHAGTDFRISINLPGVFVQSAPAYTPPRPGYVQPRPAVHPVNARNAPWGDRDRDGIPDVFDRRDDRRYVNHGPQRLADSDRDGVPDRFDRAPHNPKRH